MRLLLPVWTLAVVGLIYDHGRLQHIGGATSLPASLQMEYLRIHKNTKNDTFALEVPHINKNIPVCTWAAHV